ncbi:hypothetical protein ACLOJK_011939 [Asimina triloba]
MAVFPDQSIMVAHPVDHQQDASIPANNHRFRQERHLPQIDKGKINGDQPVSLPRPATHRLAACLFPNHDSNSDRRSRTFSSPDPVRTIFFFKDLVVMAIEEQK